MITRKLKKAVTFDHGLLVYKQKSRGTRRRLPRLRFNFQFQRWADLSSELLHHHQFKFIIKVDFIDLLQIEFGYFLAVYK
jgi:hypothetical protein